ncbi:hypothetical protein QBC42DRAFT_261632 [Cladorrhinum samala]|uniref:Uncharacterized protein n=1 Tax=Cladorrhinum samala TaxID=585594 RepID=A0AAV9HZ01_9PEZI|nr:hypothetical protein QBC42DRAFT_261632 [Cladorrhinum samala]
MEAGVFAVVPVYLRAVAAVVADQELLCVGPIIAFCLFNSIVGLYELEHSPFSQLSPFFFSRSDCSPTTIHRPPSIYPHRRNLNESLQLLGGRPARGFVLTGENKKIISESNCLLP